MDESGIGEVTQSLFFSPKAATPSDWIWGVGSVLYLDTATDDTLGLKPPIMALMAGDCAYNSRSCFQNPEALI